MNGKCRCTYTIKKHKESYLIFLKPTENASEKYVLMLISFFSDVSKALNDNCQVTRTCLRLSVSTEAAVPWPPFTAFGSVLTDDCEVWAPPAGSPVGLGFIVDRGPDAGPVNTIAVKNAKGAPGDKRYESNSSKQSNLFFGIFFLLEFEKLLIPSFLFCFSKGELTSERPARQTSGASTFNWSIRPLKNKTES